MRTSALLLLLVFAPACRACWIIHDVLPSEYAEWPLPATIQLEYISLPDVPKSQAPLVRVRVVLDEDKLKLSGFGVVTQVRLKRVRDTPDESGKREVILAEIDRRNGTAEVTVPRSVARELRLVVDCDAPKFRPCVGGSLIYRVSDDDG